MLRKQILTAALAASVIVAASACAPPPTHQLQYSMLSLGEGGILGDGEVSFPIPGSGTAAVLDADGTRAAFTTESDNVLPDDPGPGIFLRDNTTGEVQRVADRSMDLLNISADGRYVLYTERSGAPGNHHLYAYDWETANTRSVPTAGSGIGYKPVITPDGAKVIHGTSTVSFPERRGCVVSDLDGGPDMDCPTGGEGRTMTSPVSSSNGRFVVRMWWASDDSTGWNIWDRATGQLREIPIPAPPSIGGVSDDGRFVATGFSALAGFEYVDLQTNTVRLPPGITYDPVFGDAMFQGMSRDGRYLLLIRFEFDAGIPPFGGYHIGKFRWDTVTNTLTTFFDWDQEYPGDAAELPPVGGCFNFSDLTDDGGVCTLTDEALDPIDTNDKSDVYLLH